MGRYFWFYLILQALILALIYQAYYKHNEL